MLHILQQYSVDRNGRHPKLVALEHIVIKHFHEHAHTAHADSHKGAEQEKKGGEEVGEARGTRVMVFASGRDWVEEIVSRLATGGSSVKPAAFVGQAAGIVYSVEICCVEKNPQTRCEEKC